MLVVGSASGAVLPIASQALSSSPQATVVREASNISGCSPLRPSITTPIDASGHPLSGKSLSGSPGPVAVRLLYRLPAGVTMTEVIPPQGFLPQNATPAEARAYGFDAPKSQKALATWRARYAGYQRTIVTPPCVRRHSDIRWLVYSASWAGIIDGGGNTYNEVLDDQKIPDYSAPCADSIAGSWIGLGGYHPTTNGLIQQGFNSSGSAAAALWFEYIDQNSGIPPYYIGTDTHVGNVISQYMTYSSSSGGTAQFHWYDRTAGSGWTPKTVSNLSDYYDGSTADFITERGDGRALEKFSPIVFTTGQARYGSTYGDMNTLTHAVSVLTSDGTSSGTKLITQSLPSSTELDQTWQHCY